MSLQADRVAFTGLALDLFAWMRTNPWGAWYKGEKVEFAMDEWMIHTPRKVRAVAGGPVTTALDAVHIASSKHHDGLAVDLLIWVDGVYVQDGAHPIFKDINDKARSMRPDFGLGAKFRDANHLSIQEGS